MIPIALKLDGKPVLIVGGGAVAYRKAKQFLTEGAIVRIRALRYTADFQTLSVVCLHGAYDPADLAGMFLVYAATDDAKLNERIAKDCQKRQILCGSATRNDKVSMNSMAYRELTEATVALSTHRHVPYSQPLLDELSAYLKDKEPLLAVLRELREYVLRDADVPQAYFAKLYLCELSFLKFLLASCKQKKGYIYLYHPSSQQEQFNCQPFPAIALSLDQWDRYKALLIFPVNYQIIPLVVSKGVIYSRFKESMTSKMNLSEPLITCREDMRRLITSVKKDDCFLLGIFHPRKNAQLKQDFQAIMGAQGQAYDFNEPFHLEKNRSYQVLSFLMTHGSHYRDLQARLQGLKNLGYRIKDTGILTDQAVVWEIYADRLNGKK